MRTLRYAQRLSDLWQALDTNESLLLLYTYFQWKQLLICALTPLIEWRLRCVCVYRTKPFEMKPSVQHDTKITKKRELLELTRETMLIDIQHPLDQSNRVNLDWRALLFLLLNDTSNCYHKGAKCPSPAYKSMHATLPNFNVRTELCRISDCAVLLMMFGAFLK